MKYLVYLPLGLLLHLFLLGTFVQAQQQPNVVFIVIDDMNDWTTLFNDAHPIQTPHLEGLAKRGAFFTSAYASSPACNPSRASVMTGTRPHETGIYGNKTDWRKALPRAKTIQQKFSDHGYYVAGAGKIFHHQDNWAFHDNDSFHEFLLMKINEPYPPTKLNNFEWYGSRNTDWGIWPDAIEITPDYKTVEYTEAFLKRKHTKPFFLNVGIYKPHSPFFAPEEFFQFYPKADLTMPKVMEDDWTLPPGARSLLKPAKWFWAGMERGTDERPSAHQEFVQAYMAASTFADAMVGKVIDALDESSYKENTIIVVWSDHGFHIGEKKHVEKFALWEKTTHVPLIFIAPGQIEAGTVIDKPVDLTTIYPTLLELAGIDHDDQSGGDSVMPLILDPEADFPPALMTYMKGNHAIRKDNWRYIQYEDGSDELYDHEIDPYEWKNLAEDTRHQELIADLRAYIPKVNADQAADYER